MAAELPIFQELRWELPLRPVLQPLREIANPGYFSFLSHSIQDPLEGEHQNFC